LTFAFIAANRGEWPVSWMCEALAVSESGDHAWAVRPPSEVQKRHAELVVVIAAVHVEVRGRYGSPRMTAELNARGHACSENTVARLMKRHGIRAKAPRRFVRTTDSRHDLPVFENRLDRDFDPQEPNASWCAEIDYSQMTKPAGFAGRTEGEHVADLDIRLVAK
jgi:putative transposase